MAILKVFFFLFYSASGRPVLAWPGVSRTGRAAWAIENVETTYVYGKINTKIWLSISNQLKFASFWQSTCCLYLFSFKFLNKRTNGPGR